MKVSVIIPTRNRLASLRNAIISILSQDILPDEIVVIDDGSTPPLRLSDLPEFGELPIIILNNSQSRGAPFSRNIGVKNSSGDIICFLDDDDVFRPSKIAMIRDAFSSPDVDLVTSFSQVNVLDYGIGYYIKPEPDAEMQLIKNTLGTTSMICVRKKTFLEAGGFDEFLPARQDYELGIRLMRVCKKMVCIPDALVDINVSFSEGSISKSVDRNIMAIEYIRKKHGEFFSKLSGPEYKEYCLANNNFIAHKMIISGNISSAIFSLLKGGGGGRTFSSLLAALSLCFGRRFFFRLLSLRSK